MRINREKFRDALIKIRPAIANKEELQQSTSVVFLKGNAVAYNDRILISHPLPDGLSKLKGAVSAKELHDMLDKIKDDEINVKIKDDHLRIQSKNIRVDITMEAKVLLPIDEVKYPDKWKRLPKNFIEVVKFCTFSTADDMTKMGLTNVMVHGDHAMGCDGFRITRYVLETPIKTKLLIPKSAAKELVKYDAVHYGLTDGWLHFKTKAGTVFSCRQGEGDYPNVEPILTIKKSTKIKFPKELTGVLERAKIIANVDLTGSSEVTVKAWENELHVTSESSMGRFKEKLTKGINNKTNFEFVINPTFLIEILQHTRKAEFERDGSKISFKAKNEFDHVIALSTISGR